MHSGFAVSPRRSGLHCFLTMSSTPSQPAPNQLISDSEDLLDRVKTVAQQISERIRATRAPTGFSPDRLSEKTRQLSVLCVDDNVDGADSLAVLLELLGCRARACYDGPSALRIAQEFNPDACFIDLIMPEMDGLELATRLRASAGSRALLLVAVTALGSLEDRTRTAIAGFHYHFVKPVDGNTLRAAVDRFRMLLNHPVPQSPSE